MDALVEIACACGCGRKFLQNKTWQKFAMPKCRDRWHARIRREALEAFSLEHPELGLRRRS